MRNLDYLIIGAGPSGLTIAHSLLEKGVPREKILIIEANSEAGGLCRSQNIDGAPLDIGGGHFLDIRRKEVLDFLFKFMPESEWLTHKRVAKIRLRGQEIDHPLEGNLWQFQKSDQVEYLESIARTGSMAGLPMPASFKDWVQWKLGERIANEYMLPYNRKIWSMDLELLGTYWLYKLPDVSFKEALRSCLEGKVFGTLPAHGTFLYPKNFGYGEVWRRMGEALGECLLTNTPATSIDIDQRIVNKNFKANKIINTIPWTLWPKLAKVPSDISALIAKLIHIPIDVDYHPENLATDAHWIYEPQEDIAYHRILVRHNFCPNSHGYWTETNARRSHTTEHFRHHNEYAYPVNTKNKPKVIQAILDWADSKGITGAGRWGTWEHMNSDVAVSEAFKTASLLMKESP